MVLVPPELDYLLRSWEFAVAAGDVDGLIAMCTDDIEVIVNGVRPVQGPEEVAAMLQVVFSTHRMQRHVVIRNVHLDQSLAAITMDVHVSILPLVGDVPTPLSLREITLFKRTDCGSWKVAFNMTNMLRPDDVE